MASMKDVHPACALAAAWTRRCNPGQAPPLPVSTWPLHWPRLPPAHCPLLGLYQPRGNNDSDGPVRCDVLRDVRGSFTSACEVSGNIEEIDDPTRRRDRCELRRHHEATDGAHPSATPPAAGSTWKSPTDDSHWRIVLRSCQFSWVRPAPVCMYTGRISAPPGTMLQWQNASTRTLHSSLPLSSAPPCGAARPCRSAAATLTRASLAPRRLHGGRAAATGRAPDQCTPPSLRSHPSLLCQPERPRAGGFLSQEKICVARNLGAISS